MQIAQETSKRVLDSKQRAAETVHWLDQSIRMDLERHGAIRVGTPQTLATMRRSFALIGLHPVGYYDLSLAGLPMHATALRPLAPEALAGNSFRVFTTLLRPELLWPSACELAMSLLSKRSVFSPELMKLIEIGETQHALTPEQGTVFVTNAMKALMWRPITTTSYADYQISKGQHPILADAACFVSAHIGHLTPRTLDINMAHDQMKARGSVVKSRIEGPPIRSIPILLMQTSFLALVGKVRLSSTTNSQVVSSSLIEGYHRARFGEIEQRGAAVTPRGRKLYDKLLGRATKESCDICVPSTEFDEIWQSAFQDFPGDWATPVKEGPVYCIYSVSKGLESTA